VPPTATPVVDTPTPTPGETTLLEITTSGGVDSNPTVPSTFTTDAAYRITYIMDYHYYNNGALPGTIALRNNNGTVYGPWQTTGLPGQGGVANAYWVTHPNETIPAGTYTVVDSDPSTWSQNAETGHRGISTVKGVLTETPTVTPTPPVDIVVPDHLAPGDLLTVEVVINESVTEPFDAYLLADTPIGTFSIMLNGAIMPGIIAAAKNINQLGAPFKATILNNLPVPASIKGTTTLYVVLVDAGKMPPVGSLAELTPTTQYVIFMAKKTFTVQ
jgi:hypothetical protein